MDRRDTLKTLLIGSVAGGVALQGCAPKTDQQPIDQNELYGRTPAEKTRDKELNNQAFFSDHELETIATLCDIILPATPTAGSAIEAGVHDFIEFIAKDISDHQLPLRGGLMWLDAQSNARFDKPFVQGSSTEQLSIVDDIAYPDQAAEEMKYGVLFFNKMRDLTLTGYYTSKMGISDLGYKGNVPNAWDGVPEEVLNKHGLEYEAEWLSKCVDQSKRNDIAQWDDEGRLLT